MEGTIAPRAVSCQPSPNLALSTLQSWNLLGLEDDRLDPIEHAPEDVLSDGVSIYGLAPEMTWLGQGRPFGVPVPVVVLLLTALVAHVVLAHTRFGIYAQVIGDNEGAARRWAFGSSG